MSISDDDIKAVILEYINGPREYSQLLGEGFNQLRNHVRGKLQKPDITSDKMMEIVWSLIANGLAYINYSQTSSSGWTLLLTEFGKEVAQDSSNNPDKPSQYMNDLKTRIPNVSELVLLYTKEALDAYNSGCYLASSVMLGVASESAFLEMAGSFVEWLPEDNERMNLGKIVNNPKQIYINKFLEFRKRIQSHKSDLPNELTDNMSLTMDSVLDLLRIYRNESGHPTGRQILRKDSFLNLQMFSIYLEKLYALNTFFQSN